MHDKNNIYLIYKMQRRTRTRHQRKPYSTTRRVHRRRGFSKRYNRAKHTRYKKRRRRKTRRGRQRRGGTGESINSKDVCQYFRDDSEELFDFSPDPQKQQAKNCNIFRYTVDDTRYMYRNPGAVGADGSLKCSKKSAMTRTRKRCPLGRSKQPWEMDSSEYTIWRKNMDAEEAYKAKEKASNFMNKAGKAGVKDVANLAKYEINFRDKRENIVTAMHTGDVKAKESAYDNALDTLANLPDDGDGDVARQEAKRLQDLKRNHPELYKQLQTLDRSALNLLLP
jgi:hypothetical protein